MAGAGERPEPDWLADNRANWDERVPIHQASALYADPDLHGGKARLSAIEEAELGPVDGLKVLHLQCHFGRDTARLAQLGAIATGLDFSAPAITAARQLASELRLEQRLRFVESDLYAARTTLPEPAGFDLVYTSWGTISWLPDIRGWAATVAFFLKPGGRLYMADAHPTAYILDDAVPEPDGRPGWYVPYLAREVLVEESDRTYADPEARLRHTRTHSWLHPLGDVVTALIDSGMRLQWLHEHDTVTWQMFRCLVRHPDGAWGWPDRPWFPLSYSLSAERV